MFWVLVIMLGVIYVAGLALVLLFFIGAAGYNERWDDSNETLFLRSCHGYDEELAA